MENPGISVIMSTYNEKIEYLTAAIDSVLNQTFKEFEFLVVLDNPRNLDIKKCVEAYAMKDSRIIIIENQSNLGLTKSLNKAISIAKGVYMSRMDADDIMAETCLERELLVLQTEDLDLVAASKKNIDQEGRILGTFVNSFSPEQMKYLLPYDNSINHPTVLARLDIIRREGGYREIASCEDYDLWIRMLSHGCRMRILPEIFLLYRIRPDGVCESNAYQLFCSKRFVRSMYHRSKKEPDILCDDSAYNKFLIKKGMIPEKQSKFNQAYKEFCKAVSKLKKRQIRDFTHQLFKAVQTDKEIIYIMYDKLKYQLRKKIVLKFV